MTEINQRIHNSERIARDLVRDYFFDMVCNSDHKEMVRLAADYAFFREIYRHVNDLVSTRRTGHYGCFEKEVPILSYNIALKLSHRIHKFLGDNGIIYLGEIDKNMLSLFKLQVLV